MCFPTDSAHVFNEHFKIYLGTLLSFYSKSTQ